MAQWSGRLVRILLVVLVVDLAFAAVLRLDHMSRLIRGERGWIELVGVLGLGWVIVMLIVVIKVAQHLGHLNDAVTERDARLDAVIETSHDWVWETTPDLIVTYCGPTVSEALGYPAEDLIGQCFFDLVYPEDLPRVREIHRQALEAKTGWRDVETRWLHADGSLVSLQGSAVPMLNQAGDVVGFRGTRRATPGDVDTALRLAAARERVETVIAERTLRVALQPVIDMRTGAWRGVEALARFPDNRRPDLWFAEAHEVGLGHDLELLAVELALRVHDELPDQVHLAVNVSPSLITDERLTKLLLTPGRRLDRLVLEITEHALIESYDELAAILAPLRERGMALAVDDTGAGYASFSHVLRLRPDIIKLDRSLISNVAADAASRALVTAVVRLAAELDATVTAEGIEDAPQLATLRVLGVTSAQGYLIGRPTTEPARWATWRDKVWAIAAHLQTKVGAASR